MIMHRPGRAHCNVDVLSRFPCDSTFPVSLRKPSVPDDDEPEQLTANLESIGNIIDRVKSELAQLHELIDSISQVMMSEEMISR